MNFNDLLEQHLKASAADLPPHETDVKTIVAKGQRRRITSRIAVIGGVAAAVAITVALATSFLTERPAVVDSPQPPVVTTPGPDSTTAPSGATTYADVTAFFGEDGLVLNSRQGMVEIAGDRYYNGIRDVISDGDGGLLFIHSVTPPEWPQRSVLRLAAGDVRPHLLIGGPDGSVGPGNDPVRAPERKLLGLVDGGFAYTELDLDGQEMVVRVYSAAADGSGLSARVSQSYPIEEISITNVAAAGRTVAIAEMDGCKPVHVFDLDGSPSDDLRVAECGTSVNAISLSPDGTRLVALTFGSGVGRVVVVDVVSGEQLHEVEYDGWAVAWDSPEAVLLTGSEGLGSLNLTSGTFERLGTEHSYGVKVGDVTLAHLAVTGSGTGAIHCAIVNADGPELPQWAGEATTATVGTWATIRELAAECRLDELADLAESSGTALSFGGPVRLDEMWITDAAYGRDTRQAFLDVTSFGPARIEGGWVWPAVAGTGDAADWEALVDGGFLTESDVDQMREFGGYIGLRVFISDAGQWESAVAGD